MACCDREAVALCGGESISEVLERVLVCFVFIAENDCFHKVSVGMRIHQGRCSNVRVCGMTTEKFTF